MAIELKLIGFGDDRPPRFGGKDRQSFALTTPATPRALLDQAGIDDFTGLVLMDSERVIPEAQWDEPLLQDQSRLTLLSVFEGG